MAMSAPSYSELATTLCIYFPESNGVDFRDDDCDSCSSYSVSEVVSLHLEPHDRLQMQKASILSSLARHWSFGFDPRSVETELMEAPGVLKDVVHPVLKALHMGINERLTSRRSIELVERSFGNEPQYISDNVDPNYVQPTGNDMPDCGYLRLSIDSTARPIFNSMFASIVGLEASELEHNMSNPESALPFLPVDFLCMVVHDIEHFTADQTHVYTRILSSCRLRTILVSILTRKDYSPLGEVKRVSETRCR